VDNLYNSSNFDKDILSIQKVRDLLKKAKAAQEIFAQFNQGKVDKIVEAMALAGYENSRRLALMAVEETGFGVVDDKTVKNQFATKNVFEYIKGIRTAGIINEDITRKIVEIAEPVGVIAGIIPTTNPTSTVMFKSIISLKARNGIVFSPHPRAVKCSMEAARIMEEAALSAGAPKGIIGCMDICTMEATEELMKNPLTAVILATGGSAMVKAAYSSGKPSYGVGPGNVPAFIERSADIPTAVSNILLSKTFDNGTICASEQAVIAEEAICEELMNEFKKQGGYFLSPEEINAVGKTVIQQNGGVNPKVVGKSPLEIADMAGIKIPEGTRALIARLFGVGKQYPLSAEKLCPILAFYIEKDWVKSCERCYELLKYGGLGHSMSIHSNNEEIIRKFALKKPVFRILVNTPSSQGAIGYTTGLQPSLTLGCGSWGGNITADNVGPQHLINIKRLAHSLDANTGQINKGRIGFTYTHNEVFKAVEEFLRNTAS
jgi:acetaldehyde dehydrogenase (acetylating)